MTAPATVLIVLSDPALAEDTDRVVAAAGLRPLRTETPGRRVWLTATAVVLDESAARRCLRDGLPHRPHVVLVTPEDASPSAEKTAIDVGAQQICALPARQGELVRCLAEAADREATVGGSGRTIAVTAGRGGGGASTFAAALALCSAPALLVDLDPCSAGLDLLLGAESTPGLRWPDLDPGGGRIGWAAIRDALPGHRGVSVLSSARSYHEIDAAAVGSVLDAARRAGVWAVCDVPRQLGSPGVHAVEEADLVCVVTTCDVRGIAAAATLAGVLRTLNPNVGLVVRGPAASGLRAADAAEVAAVPLLAAMRAEPELTRMADTGGLRLRPRSALAGAARAVLATAAHSPEVRVA